MRLSSLRLKGAQVREGAGVGSSMPSSIHEAEGWSLDVTANGVLATNRLGVRQWIPFTCCTGGDLAADERAPGAIRKSQSRAS